jgi:hypothetical protein
MSKGVPVMKQSKTFLVVLLLVFVVVLSGCSSGPTEKDIIGKWRNTKNDNLWMEFYPDMTSTGGKWSITKDGQIKLINPDSAVLMGLVQEGKLIFPEFGEYGVYVKEERQK